MSLLVDKVDLADFMHHTRLPCHLGCAFSTKPYAPQNLDDAFNRQYTCFVSFLDFFLIIRFFEDFSALPSGYSFWERSIEAPPSP